MNPHDELDTDERTMQLLVQLPRSGVLYAMAFALLKVYRDTVMNGLKALDPETPRAEKLKWVEIKRRWLHQEIRGLLFAYKAAKGGTS